MSKADWMIPAGIVLFFVAVMADGFYNERQFRHRCETVGGILTRYAETCVKPGSILFNSN